MNQGSTHKDGQSIQSGTITGVILAGGQGKRMDGMDKGLLEVSGKTLLTAIASVLEPQVTSLMISANRNLSQYEQYGYPVITDIMPGYPGPLVGILSAMHYCDTEFLLTVPCDAPLLSPNYGARMFESTISAGRDTGVAHDGNRIQPVYTLVHRKYMDSLRDYLHSGQRSVQEWLKTLDPVRVDFSDQPQQFYNLNTAADREKIAALMEDQ